MTVALSYYLEDVDAQIAAGWTHLRLYRDTVPDGSFATVVETEELVAGQTDYAFSDLTGSASHWYRVALFDEDTPATSTKGDPFRPDATTLLDVILEGAKRAKAGFASACTSEGTVSSLVDVALVDSGVTNDFLETGYILRPNASAAGDRQRRVVKGGFDFTQGALRPTREWTNAPAADEVYHVYTLLPPFPIPGAGYSWADAARDGLQLCEYEDRVDVGTGTSARDDEFDMGVFLGFLREGDVRSVELEQYDEDTGAVRFRWDAGKRGRYWRTKPNGRGNLKLLVRPAPRPEQHVIVTANRRDAEIYALDDVTTCPLRLAARATALMAYRNLNAVHAGKFAFEVAQAQAEFDQEYYGEAPFASVQT